MNHDHDKVWLFGDYSQAEVRVVAWRGPVPKLKEWFKNGVDVHTEVARMIGRVVQENRLKLPNMMFGAKHWSEFGKGDEERELSKRTVHANDYKMGIRKYAQITGLSEQHAELLQKIYFTLFPEIVTGYHAYIENEIRRTRTIWTPEPVRWRKVFYDIINDDLLRKAYACYPQCTVGALLNKTLVEACEILRKDDPKIWTPDAILRGGYDVQ